MVGSNSRSANPGPRPGRGGVSGVTILDDLARVRELLEKPRAVAIWFVDCPSVYDAFINSPVLAAAEKEMPGYNGFGMPVYTWDTTTDGNGKLPFLKPGNRGVWVEMRNTDHVHFIPGIDGKLYTLDSAGVVARGVEVEVEEG